LPAATAEPGQPMAGDDVLEDTWRPEPAGEPAEESDPSDSIDSDDAANPQAQEDDIGRAAAYGLAPPALDQLLAEIDRGLPDGRRYSDHNSAKDIAAWRAISRLVPEKTEEQARRIIRTLVRNDVLTDGGIPESSFAPYRHGSSRREEA
jgi:hypothetical protein